jgi:crotonobetainyl-CoA:carnitine CoA-transferase CaiB-like acyl-CoA transferase
MPFADHDNMNTKSLFPLKGITVIDLSRLLPGGYCSMMLGDFGAEVIKVEEPGRGDYIRSIPPYQEDQSAFFSAVNRNKKSLILDLKNPEGKATFLRLVPTADVVLESFRPGVVDRLGIDYQSVAMVNPRVIYCSISAFGQSGPLRDRVGHDINCLALSGFLSITGIRGASPILPGIPISDYASAAMAIIAILLALIERQTSGKGQYCDISMLDTMTSWMGLHLMKYLVDGILPGPQDSMFNGALACNNVYETRDRRFIALGAVEEKFWTLFCGLIGRPDLIRLQQRELQVQEKVKEELAQVFREKTLAEWLEMLEDKGICFSPVLNLQETLNLPQLQARGMFQPIQTQEEEVIPQVGFPIKLSHTPATYQKIPPMMGQDSRDVLERAGFSLKEIQKLERKGIVGRPASEETL